MTFGTLRARRGRRENLPRQIRGRGMRDRVVRVDDIEPEFARECTICLASESRYWGSRKSG